MERLPGKRRSAVALRYERNKHAAPMVVAKGKGYLAEQIIALGREHGLPFTEDPLLADALMALDIGGEIPAELYEAVARVLAHVYELDRQAGS